LIENKINPFVTGGEVSPVLKKARVEIISNKECSLKYQGSVTDRMLCAYTPDIDACQVR